MTPINLNQLSPAPLEGEEHPSTLLQADTFSFPCPIFFNIPQDQGTIDGEHHYLHPEQQANELSSIGDSSDNRSLPFQKSEQSSCDRVQWTSSKMRMMRKMMSSDHVLTNNPINMMQSLQHHHQELTQDSNSSSGNSNNFNGGIIIRVCSDCNTTKTPLWRSGPRGPKSLCNACGIRQRKARRATAAAAAAAAAAVIGGSTHSDVQREKISDWDRTVPYKKRWKFTA